MTPNEMKAAIEYCKDLDAKAAGIRAGSTAAKAAEWVEGLLDRPDFQDAVQSRLKDLGAAVGVTIERVIREYATIAFADPNEVVSVRHLACRYCYGLSHRYQWVDMDEWEWAASQAAESDPPQPTPDMSGGFGYTIDATPVADCPKCFGHGIDRVLVADTTRLSAGGKALYDGAKQGQKGIEIKLRSRDEALGRLAKYLGMDIERKEISGPGGAPIAISAAELSDDQLAALIAKGALEDTG